MRDLEIRKSRYNDIDDILKIYEEAREFMKKSGNPHQWKDNYPKKELILEDIESGKSYVCIAGDKIVATFYFAIEEDPTYLKIYNGQWLDDRPYGVVHRIATTREKNGAGSFCLQWSLNESGNIRIDTHIDNIPMQNLLRKNGFSRCGIIYTENGDERIAFQKIIC